MSLCQIHIQSNPITAPLYIPPPLHFTLESLGTEIPYVISKGKAPLPPATNFCGKINVPLSIMKSPL
jgi:hypothetical protein